MTLFSSCSTSHLVQLSWVQSLQSKGCKGEPLLTLAQSDRKSRCQSWFVSRQKSTALRIDQLSKGCKGKFEKEYQGLYTLHFEPNLFRRHVCNPCTAPALSDKILSYCNNSLVIEVVRFLQNWSKDMCLSKFVDKVTSTTLFSIASTSLTSPARYLAENVAGLAIHCDCVQRCVRALAVRVLLSSVRERGRERELNRVLLSLVGVSGGVTSQTHRTYTHACEQGAV